MFSKIKRLGTTACQLQISIDLRELTILEIRDDIELVCIVFERKTKAISSSQQVWSDEKSPSLIVFDESIVLLTTLYKDSTGKFLEKSGNLVLKGYSSVTSLSVAMGFASVKLNALAADYAPQRLTLQFVDGKGKAIGNIKASVTAKYLGDIEDDDDCSSVMSSASVRSVASVRSIQSGRSNMSFHTSEKLQHGLVYKESSKFFTESPMSQKTTRRAPKLPSLIFDNDGDGDGNDMVSIASQGSGRHRNDTNAERRPSGSVSSRSYHSADIAELVAKIESLQAEVDELNGLLYQSHKSVVDSNERSDISQALCRTNSFNVDALQAVVNESESLIARLTAEKLELTVELKKGREREAVAGEITRALRRDVEIAQSGSAAVQISVFTIELTKIRATVETMREHAAVQLTEKSLLIDELGLTKTLLTEAEELSVIETTSKMNEIIEKEKALKQVNKTNSEIEILRNALYDLEMQRVKAEKEAEETKKVAEAASIRFDDLTVKLNIEISGLQSALKVSKEETDHLQVEASKSVVLRGLLTQQVQEAEARCAITSASLAKQQSLVMEFSQKLLNKEHSFVEMECSFAASESSILTLQSSKNEFEEVSITLKKLLKESIENHSNERQELLSRIENLLAEVANNEKKGLIQFNILNAEIEKSKTEIEKTKTEKKTEKEKYYEELKSKVSECDELRVTLSEQVATSEVTNMRNEDIISKSQLEISSFKIDRHKIEAYINRLYLDASELKVCRIESDRQTEQVTEVTEFDDVKSVEKQRNERLEEEKGNKKDNENGSSQSSIEIKGGRSDSGDNLSSSSSSSSAGIKLTKESQELSEAKVQFDQQLELISQQMILSKARETSFSTIINSLRTQNAFQIEDINQKDIEKRGLRSDVARHLYEAECLELHIAKSEEESIELAASNKAKVKKLEAELLAEREEGVGLMTEIEGLQSASESAAAIAVTTAAAKAAAIDGLERELGEEKERVLGLSKEGEERAAEIYMLKMQIDHICAESAEAGAAMTAANDTLEEGLFFEKEKVSTLTVTGEERIKEIAGLKIQLQSLKDEHAEVAFSSKAQMKKLNTELLAEREEGVGLMTEMASLQAEVAGLQSQIAEDSEIAVATALVTAATVASLEGAVSAEKERVERLEQELSDEKERVAGLSMSGDERMVEIASLQSQIEGLCADKVETAAATAATVQDLQQDVRALEGKVSSMSMLVEARKIEILDLHLDIKTMGEESAEAATITAAASATAIEGLTGKLGVEKERVSSLKMFCEDCNIEIAESKAAAETAAALAAATAVSSAATVEYLESEVRAEKERVSELSATGEERMVEIAGLQSQIDSLCTDEVETAEAIAATALATATTLEGLERALGEEKEKVSRLSTIGEEHLIEISGLHEELESLRGESADASVTAAATIAGLEYDVQAEKDRVGSMSMSGEERMVEMAGLQAQIKSLCAESVVVAAATAATVEGLEQELEGERERVAGFSMMGEENMTEIASLQSQIAECAEVTTATAIATASTIEDLEYDVCYEKERAASLSMVGEENVAEINGLQTQIEEKSQTAVTTAIATAATAIIIQGLNGELEEEREMMSNMSTMGQVRMAEIDSLRIEMESMRCEGAEAAAASALALQQLQSSLDAVQLKSESDEKDASERLVLSEKHLSQSLEQLTLSAGKIKSVEESLHEVTEELHSLHSLYDRLEEDSGIEMSSAVKRTEVIENERRELNEQIKRLEEKNKSIEEELDVSVREHTASVAREEILREEKDSLIVKEGGLEEELKENKRIIVDLEEKLSSTDAQLSSSQSQLAATKALLSSSESQLASIEALLGSSVSEGTDLTNERDGLLVERIDLTAQKEALTNERDGLVAERYGLIAAITDLTTEVTDLTTERDLLINKGSDPITDKEALIAERTDLTTERDGLIMERDRLLIERIDLCTERTDLLRLLEENKISFESQAKTPLTEKEEREMMIKEEKEERDMMHLSEKEERERYHLLENNERDLMIKEERDMMILASDSKIQDISSQLSVSDLKLQEILSQLLIMTNEKKQLQVEVEQLKSELVSQSTDMEDDMSINSAECGDLKREIERLKAFQLAAESKQFGMVESYEDEIHRMQEEENDNLERSIQDFRLLYVAERKVLKDEIETLKESYLWLQGDYNEIKTECHNLEEKVDDLEEFVKEERTRCENQVIVLLKAVGLYDSSLDFRDNYWVELFRLQLDEERMKIMLLKNCLVKFSDKLSGEDTCQLLEHGIILATDVIGH